MSKCRIPLILALILSCLLTADDQSLSGKKEYFVSLEDRINSILSQMSVQEKIEQLYYKTDGNVRLGIPQFTGSDGPHGIGNKAKGWSCFPVTIAMTASWDPELIYRVGKAISIEQASRQRHRIAGPTLDLLHDPRNGRASETIGEDPFLGGRISEAFILGQNATAVFGSIKHYNLNTYEAKREHNNYLIDQRSLVEFWGGHWKRAIQDGGAMSIMCAYNLVNGEKCAENGNLIKTILRDMWGFEFYTMCDWGGFWSTPKAIKSEMDFCEGNDLYIKELPALVKNRTVDISMVDNAVRNILRTKILAGMLDGQPNVPSDARDCRKHRELVYESGLKSIILLKNQDRILPFGSAIGSIALIGPNVAVLPLDGHSSSAVIPSYTITLKEGIEMIIGADRVKYLKGCDINSKDRSQFDRAKEVARSADVVIFAGGLDDTVEGEGYFIGGDRMTGSVDLPGLQNDLINELASVNPNMVLVVISGGTCAVNKVISNVKAMLYAFYPGQEGGKALADILFGNYNPSGKLPVTVPKGDAQLPSTDMDFKKVVTEGVGYRWFDSQKITPEFAFGSGLSYTTFKYSGLIITPEIAPAGQEVRVQVDLTNTGKRAGEEVAQLYLSTDRLNPDIPMPAKQLKGFKKIHLEPGQTRRIEFTLTPEELYIFDEAKGRYIVPAGSYIVRVGGASDCLFLSGRFSLTKADEKPDLLIKNIRSIPPFPKKEEQVFFLASILNRGTGPSPAGVVHQVTFHVNGKVISWSNQFQDSIPAGGMAMVCGSQGPDSKPCWTAADGTWSITAEIDDKHNISETNEENNVCRGKITLPDGKIVPK
jgi:beta-glucosidase